MHIKKNAGVYILIFGLFLVYFFAHYARGWKEFSQKGIISREPLIANIPPPPVVDYQQIFHRKEIMVMGWNVENLFDTEDELLTHDDEYTPYGQAEWNEEALEKKIYNLTDVIRRVNGGLGPDIIGLCEVENMSVLKKLAFHPNIRKLQYHYQYLQDANDPRGIDVALLSRYRAKVTWHPIYPGGRDILQAEIQIRGATLYVLVNHWRSRRGGRTKTEYRRIQSAQKCLQIVKTIESQNPYADIVILGDFNDNPDDPSLRYYLKAVPYNGKNNNAFLYNLAQDSFDQIIISRGLLDRRGFYYIPRSFEIIVYPFMCDRKGQPRSFSPLDGKGYSDHFPVVALLGIE